MRSKASIKGHPIHPAIVMFPLASLWLAFGFDLAGALTNRAGWWTTGGYLTVVGIAAAFVAAVPGFIDYVGSVPPRSTGKARATKHLLVNASAVALFAVSWAVRGDATVLPATIVLVLQGAGAALIGVGGWLGGTLVVRNQIGVDHRYAEAGRWQEETRTHAERRALTSSAAALGVNQMKLVHVDGRRIVVGRSETGAAAFQDRCTHKGGPLSDGVLICGTVQCPWHGSQFDVHTGEVKCGPATEKIETYPVEDAHRVKHIGA
jgi:uncharacterized membrane protein/nitrite reductase/ring-hydroxylating ferredoxin subunit